MEQGRVRLDTHKIGYRYTDTESAEDSLDHNESCHADTIVETDVTEEYRRKNTVHRICFQNRSLPESLRNRKKGYSPEDLHGKSRIRGRYLNLTSYPAFASNEPRIIPLNRSPICNATNHPPMNYETVYSKSCKKIKNRITPEARFLLFLRRSIHDRSVSMQDLQGVQAFPQT